MPAAEVMRNSHPVTRSDLVKDLRALGVRPGGVLMVHTRMSAIGWVVGGADTVVMALLDVLGAAGTLMAYVGWNDGTGGLAGWPPECQEAYRSECPPFEPEFCATDRQMGRVPERIRTWPGAKVSGSHFRRMAAIGSSAGWLTEDQPWDRFRAGLAVATSPTTTRPRRLAPSPTSGQSATRIRLRSSASWRSMRAAVSVAWSGKLKVTCSRPGRWCDSASSG